MLEVYYCRSSVSILKMELVEISEILRVDSLVFI